MFYTCTYCIWQWQSLEREVRGSNLGLVKSNTVLPTGATTRIWAPQTRYTLRRNTASIMKDLIWYFVLFLAATRVDLWGRLTLIPPIIPFIPAKRNCKSQEFRFCCCWTFSGFSDAQDVLLQILRYSEEKVYSRTARSATVESGSKRATVCCCSITFLISLLNSLLELKKEYCILLVVPIFFTNYIHHYMRVATVTYCT